MANTLSGNVWYVDTAYAAASDDITTNLIIGAIVLTVTGAGGRIVLSDPKTGATKLDLRIATDEQSELFDFSNTPIACPNGLRVTTLTTAVASIIGARGGN